MTITPSIPFGKQKQDLSSAEWHGIWLKKLEQACAVDDLKETTTKGFSDFINRYLSLHTCHPKRNKKSEKQAKFCRDALVFFYENVIPSKKHIEVIKWGSILNFPTPPKPPQGDIIKPPLKMPQKTAEEINRASIPGYLKNNTSGTQGQELQPSND
jgi:hypothetical protein